MARAGLGPSWDCLLANDISPMKAMAYAANYGSDHLRLGDIYGLTPNDLPGNADMAWGSFPCQDLSLAGAKAGLEGKRSGCFWGFWDLVEGLHAEGRKPPLVVLENVYGALTSRNGADFETIVRAIEAQNFRVAAMVIDAVHFVPQSRPRLFIIGIDKSLSIPSFLTSETPHPTWHPDAMVRAYERLSTHLQKAWVWFNPDLPDKRRQTLEDLIEEQPADVQWHSHAHTTRLLSMMSPVNREKVIASQAGGRRRVGTIYRRTRLGEQRAEVRFDGVAGCLRTPSGGSSRQTIIVVEGPRVRTRLLSAREAARLMGLDESYKLPARYNDAYHVAGDGVVAPVVSYLARNIIEPLLQQDSCEMQRKAA